MYCQEGDHAKTGGADKAFAIMGGDTETGDLVGTEWETLDLSLPTSSGICLSKFMQLGLIFNNSTLCLSQSTAFV